MVWDFTFTLTLLLGSTLIGCQQTPNGGQLLPPPASISASPIRPPSPDELYLPYPEAGVPQAIDSNSQMGSVNKNVLPPVQLSPIEKYETNYQPVAPLRDWKFLVLHHTASENGSVDSINKTHLERKDAQGNPWKGIGYHFVIGNGQGMADGEIKPTFRWMEQMTGAHAGQKLYNEEGIGICLVGNFENHTPSQKQLVSVKELVAQLKVSFEISDDRIIGHRSIKPTECPGKLFPLTEITSFTNIIR